ncbi:hypothetical protein Droror1_Dr00022994 [Drosera rotundifolia]
MSHQVLSTFFFLRKELLCYCQDKMLQRPRGTWLSVYSGNRQWIHEFIGSISDLNDMHVTSRLHYFSTMVILPCNSSRFVQHHAISNADFHTDEPFQSPHS